MLALVAGGVARRHRLRRAAEGGVLAARSRASLCVRRRNGPTPFAPARTRSSTLTTRAICACGARARDVPRRRAEAVRRRQGRRSASSTLCTLGARELGRSPSSARATSACRSHRRSREAGKQGRARRRGAGGRRRAQPRREPHQGRSVRGARAARRSRARSARRPTTPQRARRAPILIAVPTPLSRQREPDLSYIESAARSLAPHLRAGQLVVLESTTYPGTTREVLQPLLEEGSGLKAGADFHLAYLARARRSRQRATSRRRRRRRSSAASTPRRHEAAAALYRQRRSSTVAHGLDARGGRADEAAREHLPLGQHRARQRARAALRPDGHRRLGGRRRRGDEAVRLHVVQAGPRPRRPLHPDRSVLPDVEGARVRLLDAVHRARRRGEQQHAVLLPLGRLAGAEPRRAEVARAARRSSCSASRTRPTSATCASRPRRSWCSCSATPARTSRTTIRTSPQFDGHARRSPLEPEAYDCVVDRDRALVDRLRARSCGAAKVVVDFRNATEGRRRSTARSGSCERRSASVGLGYWGPNLARNFDELGDAALALRPRPRRCASGSPRAIPRARCTPTSTSCSPTTSSTASSSRRRCRPTTRSRSRRSRRASTSLVEKPPAMRAAEMEELVALADGARARADARPPAALPPGRPQAEGADRRRRARRRALRLRQPPEPRQDPHGRERAVVARRPRPLGDPLPARRGAVGGDRARARLPHRRRRGRRLLLPALPERQDRAHAPVVARPAQDAAASPSSAARRWSSSTTWSSSEGDDLREGAEEPRRRATASGRRAPATSSARRSRTTSRCGSSARSSCGSMRGERRAAARSRATGSRSCARSSGCRSRSSMAAEVHPTAIVYPGTVLGDGVQGARGRGRRQAADAVAALDREARAAAAGRDRRRDDRLDRRDRLRRARRIGARVILGDQSCVRERVTIGDDVVVGRGSLVENDTTIGALTKIQADAYITAYSTLEENVFIAPCVVTTNDNFMGRTEQRHELIAGPTIRRGARVGGGADPLPGRRDRRGGVRRRRRRRDEGRAAARSSSSATRRASCATCRTKSCSSRRRLASELERVRGPTRGRRRPHLDVVPAAGRGGAVDEALRRAGSAPTRASASAWPRRADDRSACPGSRERAAPSPVERAAEPTR